MGAETSEAPEPALPSGGQGTGRPEEWAPVRRFKIPMADENQIQDLGKQANTHTLPGPTAKLRC